jgi:hypothetical protein
VDQENLVTISDWKEGSMAPVIAVGVLPVAQREAKDADSDKNFRTLVDCYVEALILIRFSNHQRPTGHSLVFFAKRLGVISSLQAKYPDFQTRVLGCLEDESKPIIKANYFTSDLEFLLGEIYKSRLI